MARTDFRSVDQYVAAQPEAARPVLETVRRAIREALPDAEETISYQIPTFKLGGKAVIYFAGWKEHWSLYPVGADAVEAFPELAGHETSKGTIRFPLAAPVPVAVVQALARRRADAVRAELAAKTKPRGAREAKPTG